MERAVISATEAVKRGQFAEAEELIAIVQSVDPGNKNMETMVQVLVDARGVVLQREREQLAARVATAIASGKQALADQRIDSPTGNNALEFFQQALRQDPENTQARNGIGAVVEAHLARALHDLKSKDFAGAGAKVASAAAIDPNHAGIEPARQAIARLRADSAGPFSQQRITALIDAAQEHRAAGRLVTPPEHNALESYRAVLQMDPDNAAAGEGIAAIGNKFLQLIATALRTNDFEQARTYLRQARDIGSPRNLAGLAAAQAALDARLAEIEDGKQQAKINALLATADAAFSAGRLRTPQGNNALEGYLQVLMLAPDNTLAAAGITRLADRYVELAEDSISVGNLELAIEHMTNAEQMLPKLATLVPLRSRIQAARAERGSSAERTIATQEQLAAALSDAQTALSAGRLSAPADASALMYYRVALKVAPENPEARVGIEEIARIHVANAFLAITNERFEAAEAQIAAAAAIEPLAADLQSARASLVAARERADIEDLRLQIDTELAAAQAALAQGQLVTTDGTGALEHYHAALALDPGNAIGTGGIRLVFDALVRRANAALAAGEIYAARQAAEQAARAMPGSASVTALQAQIKQASTAKTEHQDGPKRLEELLADAATAAARTDDAAALESAARLYGDATRLAPGDDRARRGLSKVAEDFGQLLASALEERRTDDGRRLLDVANQMFPQAPWLAQAQSTVQADAEAGGGERQATINALLKRAERQLKRFHLTTPIDNNATATYREILKLDPQNKQGQRGFERVVEHYMVLAERELQLRGATGDARHFVTLAASVIAGHGESRDRAVAILRTIGDLKSADSANTGKDSANKL